MLLLTYVRIRRTNSMGYRCSCEFNQPQSYPSSSSNSSSVTRSQIFLALGVNNDKSFNLLLTLRHPQHLLSHSPISHSPHPRAALLRRHPYPSHLFMTVVVRGVEKMPHLMTLLPHVQMAVA